MPLRLSILFIAVSICIQLLCGCKKTPDQQNYIDIMPPAIQSGPAQLHPEKDWHGLGIATKQGMKPFAWPKRLVSLPLGQKVRYRDTAYFVYPHLEDVLGDKVAIASLFRGDEVIARNILLGLGEFEILDVDSPLPILSGWGQRADGYVSRILVVPKKTPEELRYLVSYVELYTTNRSEALSLEPLTVRPETNVLTCYFLGRMPTTTPEDAQKYIEEARKQF